MDELVAQFLAKGGQIKRVASGERTITEKQFWDNRGDKAPAKLSAAALAEADAIKERHYVTGSNGREHCRNGLGEWIY